MFVLNKARKRLKKSKRVGNYLFLFFSRTNKKYFGRNLGVFQILKRIMYYKWFDKMFGRIFAK